MIDIFWVNLDTTISMARFKIGNLDVGDNFKPVVIVEIGINHNGILEKAINLADKAISSGAEIIKHQTHIPDAEMSEEAKNILPANAPISIYRVIKQNSLS